MVSHFLFSYKSQLTNFGQSYLLPFLLHVVCNRVQPQQYDMESTDMIDMLDKNTPTCWTVDSLCPRIYGLESMESPNLCLTQRRSQVRVLFRPLWNPHPWGFFVLKLKNPPSFSPSILSILPDRHKSESLIDMAWITHSVLKHPHVHLWTGTPLHLGHFKIIGIGKMGRPDRY